MNNLRDICRHAMQRRAGNQSICIFCGTVVASGIMPAPVAARDDLEVIDHRAFQDREYERITPGRR